jgi:hypothetical protein
MTWKGIAMTWKGIAMTWKEIAMTWKGFAMTWKEIAMTDATLNLRHCEGRSGGYSGDDPKQSHNFVRT